MGVSPCIKGEIAAPVQRSLPLEAPAKAGSGVDCEPTTPQLRDYEPDERMKPVRRKKLSPPFCFFRRFSSLRASESDFAYIKRKTSESSSKVSQKWLRGWDLNPRPSGYEPDELPGCSTPRFEEVIKVSESSVLTIGKCKNRQKSFRTGKLPPCYPLSTLYFPGPTKRRVKKRIARLRA